MELLLTSVTEEVGVLPVIDLVKVVPLVIVEPSLEST